MTTLRKKLNPNVFLPRTVESSNITLSNLVTTRAHRITTKLVDTKNTFSFQLIPVKNHEVSTTVVLYLRIWGEPSILKLSGWPLSKNLKELLTTNEEILELPEELALITLSVVFEPLIETISNSLSTTIEIIGFSLCDTDTRGDDHSKINFSFKTENEPEQQAVLIFPNTILGQFKQVIKMIPASSSLSPKKIQIPVYYEFGKTTITQSMLRSIELGDVLMMDSHASFFDQAKQTLNLRLVTNQIFSAERNENSNSYHLIKEEKAMSHDDYENNISLDEIPLNVHFDIGEQSISLEEIEQIGVGYTFEVEKKLPELITLRVSNKKIGHGELVTIGDRMGVRITQINQE